MYKQVFEAGRTLRGSPLTVRFLRAESDWSRVGFIIRKKTGDAPFRNSVRRTLRRTFQEALPSIPEGLWILFDVSDKAKASTRSQLQGEAQRLLLAAHTVAAAGPAVPVRLPPTSGYLRRFRNRDAAAASESESVSGLKASSSPAAPESARPDSSPASSAESSP
jgi:ribonuclease P protein component